MSSTVPPPPGPLLHPDLEAEVEAEAEVGAAAGCHPEEVAGATTMEAHPGAAVVVAAVEGAVVAVAVAVGVAATPPLDDERV